MRSERRIQTALEGDGEKLSEVASSSDRFGRVRGKAVQSSIKF
ncbi:hypothetical protein SAMD00020551_2523 [Mesobacillus selenatarsenatis SF-1]|uniref:Uncharacterized protein n=1 Tax=Mesobacillus selenatarsenatis (strain DSM 18680 / JCM 14380 / FERM P-15431 / SF-1) TaxID=1321606 RepID=A0A0A8X564_MESS1|nr:hypothetical protein SAMD00020551_2523 [Mesobacillus selenatarsenatis SF-1]